MSHVLLSAGGEAALCLCNSEAAFHLSTPPSIMVPSISEACFVSGCYFTRATFKGSRVVSMETAHFRGRREKKACVWMLRVAMETGATAYISIHRVSLPHGGTFRHKINIGSVLLAAVTNYNSVVWSGRQRCSPPPQSRSG